MLVPVWPDSVRTRSPQSREPESSLAPTSTVTPRRRAYRLCVHDPEDGGGLEPSETLEGGSGRPPAWERISPRWRLRVVSLLVFVLGVAAGVSAVVWRQTGPEPGPSRGDEHAVELVLFQALPTGSSPSGREPRVHPLYIDGAILLSGLVTSTIVSITASGIGLNVRVPALPVTVSPTARLHELALRITVRECKAAARWTPRERPFAVSWRDEYGQVHLDRAGDFGPSVAESMSRYIHAVCDKATR